MDVYIFILLFSMLLSGNYWLHRFVSWLSAAPGTAPCETSKQTGVADVYRILSRYFHAAGLPADAFVPRLDRQDIGAFTGRILHTLATRVVERHLDQLYETRKR